MTEQIANSLTDPTATLTAGIAAGDTSLVVSGWASPLPAAGTFRIRIGSEIILVGSVSGTTLGSLTRGAESTTAASHASGADVDLVLTAGGLAAYVSENGGSQPGAGPVTFRTFAFAFDTPGIVPKQLPITAVDQGAQKLTVAGDHTADFPVGFYFYVGGSTGNDAYYTVASVTFASGHTNVVTNEAIPDATVDGVLRNASTAGAALYTPDAGEWLISAGMAVLTAWDGTTPKADMGSLYNGENAMFQRNHGPVALDVVDTADFSMDMHAQLAQGNTPNPSDAFMSQLDTLSFPGGEQRQLPARFITNDPFKVVVSTDGSVVGADPGSAQGAGLLYLVTAKLAS